MKYIIIVNVPTKIEIEAPDVTAAIDAIRRQLDPQTQMKATFKVVVDAEVSE